MSTRTQIYLDDDQRRALKLLAASSNSTMSDLVRRAIDRLLSEEFAGKNWAPEMSAIVHRLRSSVPAQDDDAIDAVVQRRRQRRHKVKA